MSPNSPENTVPEEDTSPDTPESMPSPVEAAAGQTDISEQVKTLITHLDNDPDLSDEERQIAEQSLQRLGVSYEEGRLEGRVLTRESLRLLETELGAEYTAAMSDSALEHTDIAMLTDTVDDFVRQKEVVDTLNGDGFDDARDILGLEDGAEITIERMRLIPVDKLVALEERYNGVLFYMFTDLAEEGGRMDFTRAKKLYDTPPEGQRLVINFRGNLSAEAELGAGDVMPPSVRGLTHYSRGQDSLKRVSDRRIGLQGKDRPGTGFFDQDGYIPIYTGDHVVLGKVEAEFTKKYRKEIEWTNPKTGETETIEGWDEAAYQADHGEKDAEFLKPIQKKHGRMSKRYTPDELRAINEGLKLDGVPGAIVDAAHDVLNEGYRAKHCWDWVSQVYKTAGMRHTTIYKHEKYKRGMKYNYHELPHENPPEMSNLQAGDWLYICNWNRYVYGDHSVLFEKWNEPGKTAWVYSCPGAGKQGRRHLVDFSKTPITYIMKPQPTSAFRRRRPRRRNRTRNSG